MIFADAPYRMSYEEPPIPVPFGVMCLVADQPLHDCQFVNCQCSCHFKPNLGCACAACVGLRELGWNDVAR